MTATPSLGDWLMADLDPEDERCNNEGREAELEDFFDWIDAELRGSKDAQDTPNEALRFSEALEKCQQEALR